MSKFVHSPQLDNVVSRGARLVPDLLHLARLTLEHCSRVCSCDDAADKGGDPPESLLPFPQRDTDDHEEERDEPSPIRCPEQRSRERGMHGKEHYSHGESEHRNPPAPPVWGSGISGGIHDARGTVSSFSPCMRRAVSSALRVTSPQHLVNRTLRASAEDECLRRLSMIKAQDNHLREQIDAMRAQGDHTRERLAGFNAWHLEFEQWRLDFDTWRHTLSPSMAAPPAPPHGDDDSLRNIVLVTGSRSFGNAAQVNAMLDDAFAHHLPFPLSTVELLHGGARGVDMHADAWGRAHGLPVRVVPPDFQLYPRARFGNRAYAMRDLAMAMEAAFIVALWDGISKGTQITVAAGRRLRKEVFQVVAQPVAAKKR